MFSEKAQAGKHFAKWLTRCACALIVVSSSVAISDAHEGPPFPILVDRELGDYSISVWADPDIGEATFYVIVETPAGGEPAIPPVVKFWTEPIDGRLDRVTYDAPRDEVTSHMQFAAKPYFDQRDMWNIGVRLTNASGESVEWTSEIESTPPGFGVWDLAIYSFPFLLIGGLWMLAIVRRRHAAILLAEQEAAEIAGETTPAE